MLGAAAACLLLLSGAQSVLSRTLQENERGPPQQRTGSAISSPPPWTDLSAYTNLGDGVGSAVAYGDFTRDRYGDLVIADKQEQMRSLHISIWRPREYSFRRAINTWNSSEYKTRFSLDSMARLPVSAYIASVSTIDANADGSLDLIMSIFVTQGMYVGLILLGNGKGGLRLGPRLPELGPDLLLMDANNDLITDILFSRPDGSLAFYHNSPPGSFSMIQWTPFSAPKAYRDEYHTVLGNVSESSMYGECIQSHLLTTNAFVDMNGDCLPDLVLTTANCGMLVWLNEQTNPRMRNGRRHSYSRSSKAAPAFWDLSIFLHKDRFVALSRKVWDRQNGDGVAVFADFNADGTNDVAVANYKHAVVRISLNLQPRRPYGELCSANPSWTLDPYNAIRNLRLSTTILGPSYVPGALHIGDFNYDGLMDILAINADTGALELHEAIRTSNDGSVRWPEGGVAGAALSDTFGDRFGPFRQWDRRRSEVFFRHVPADEILFSLEDPIAAAFIDLDESGRQDLLIVQSHGTRLVRNNYNEVDDSEFFKATCSNLVLNQTGALKSVQGARPSVPLHGGTLKISYGGRNGHEQHICSQCPQAGLLALQSCSCIFGIRRIANYIEEMSTGAGGMVRSWSALMPNAIAFLWPLDSRALHWRVTYFTNSRGRQMAAVVIVFGITLIVLTVTIAYLESAEAAEVKTDERQSWQDFRY